MEINSFVSPWFASGLWGADEMIAIGYRWHLPCPLAPWHSLHWIQRGYISWKKTRVEKPACSITRTWGRADPSLESRLHGIFPDWFSMSQVTGFYALPFGLFSNLMRVLSIWPIKAFLYKNNCVISAFYLWALFNECFQTLRAHSEPVTKPTSFHQDCCSVLAASHFILKWCSESWCQG